MKAASTLEFERRHLVANPLIGFVDEIDTAIAILQTAEMALGNPGLGDVYDTRCIIAAMDHAATKLSLCRNTAQGIIDGGGDA